MKFLHAFGLFLMAALLAANTAASERKTTDSGRPDKGLRYYLEMKPRYIRGEPIVLTFTLENQSKDTLWVLTWYTPLEGMLGRFLEVSCDRKEMPYEGPMVKRAPPNSSDYQRLAPGESVSADIDLAQYYDFPADTPCQVSFTGKIHDVFSGNVFLEGTRGNEFSDWTIEGNSAEFTINAP